MTDLSSAAPDVTELIAGRPWVVAVGLGVGDRRPNGTRVLGQHETLRFKQLVDALGHATKRVAQGPTGMHAQITHRVSGLYAILDHTNDDTVVTKLPNGPHGLRAVKKC